MNDSIEPAGLNEIVGAARARITGMREVSRLKDVEFESLRVVHPLTRNERTLNRFSELVTQLIDTCPGPNFVVGVTGLASGVGVSYVAMNTAVTLALDIRRTSLLIQCNPRRTALDRMLIPPPEAGLSEYLVQPELHVNDIVYAPGVARMRVIPFGHEPPDVALLGSERMQQLLHTMRVRYSDRFIVLDLPRTDELATVQPLLDCLDATILVVPYGRVRTAEVRRAIDLIGDERLAGLVLNRVPGS